MDRIGVRPGRGSTHKDISNDPQGGKSVLRNGFLSSNGRRAVRRGLALAGIASLLPWPTGVLLGASIAQAAKVNGVSITGGAGTTVVNGALFARPGASLTLDVVTDNDTQCVRLTGAHTAEQKAAKGTTQWSFPLTAGSTGGVKSVTAVAFKGVNGNGVCTGDAGESGNSTVSYTVETDNTAPVVTAAVTPAANAAGWHKGNVDIKWSATDFGSGVAAGFPTPGTDSVTAETPVAGVTKTSTAKDVAGNTGTGSVTIRLDKTAPAVTATADRPANGAGWYAGDVTAAFSATDTLSGVASTSAPKVLGEGAGQSATGTARDNAGNDGTATLSGINVDKTAPTLSAATTSAPNAAGWYNGPVGVKWTAGDALSGLATPPPADTVLSTEGANQSISTTVADKAGNTRSASSPAISIDRTAPNTSAVAPSGWSNIDQTVTLDANDGLSLVKDTFYKLDGDAAKSGKSVAISGNGTHTLEYWSVDNAGNAETHKSVEVMIDGTSPTISHSLAPAANGAGWNNADVTVKFTCDDPLSGIASCTPDKLVADEGTGQVITGTAIDNAGNTATDPAIVNLDETPPTIEGSTDRAANGAGWYKDGVTVSFLAEDERSGIDTFTAPQKLGEGANQSVTGTAKDVAGNSADDTVAGIDIDETAPSLSGSTTSDPNAAGWYHGDVTVHWVASDALSGLDGAAPADETIKAEGNALSASATVSDNAGNEKTATVDGIRIDRTAPTTSVDTTELPESGWYTDDLQVSLDAHDNLSGVAKTYYTVDGGPAQQYTGPFSHGLDGKHEIAFWSVDKAGNAEKAGSIEVRVDRAKPTIAGARTPAANGFGWNNGDVVVSFDCDDADSGIADCSPAATTLSNEGAGQKVNGVATDVAGNTASATVDGVNIDKTLPTLQGAALAAPNAAGWYKGDVTVHWTAEDNLSGIDPATVPADSVVKGEGGNLGTGDVSVADKAGNPATASMGGIKIDRTAPVISGAATTSPNAAGWYSGEVSVAFSCTDNLSGMASCPDNKVLKDSGAAQAVTSEPAEDLAGNTTAGKTVGGISIDGLAPQTIADNQCTKTNGWCTGSTANVVLSSTDQSGLSGVKEIRYSVNGGAEQVATGATKTVSVPLDGSGNATVSYYAVDKADNKEPVNTVGLKYDNIAPMVTHTVTPAPNADEWNNSDVKVHFDAKDDDSGSGVATARTTPDRTVSAETPFAGTDILGEAFDLAGNKGTDKVTVKLDRSPPAIKAEVVSGQLGGNGWYTGPVTVHYTCSDALSGVKVCPRDEVVNSNGAAQKATGEAIDAAGNKAMATVAVDIDQVKPAPKVAGVDKAIYALGTQPSPTCSATDEHSGVASCTVSTTGGNANGVGEYTVTATATDKAGNSASSSVKYRVVYKWDGFRQPITDTAHDLGSMSTFKAGSTVPVKYQVKKADGTVVQGAAGSWITPVKGAVTFAGVTEDGTGIAADSGSQFRWDGTERQWIYNWGTAKTDANKQLTIGVKLDDGQVYSTVIGLR
jgi:hypothetical protein